MPTLLILNGPQAGVCLTILGERFALGRDAECDLVISVTPKQSGAVSRRHALLTCSKNQWFIEDGDGKGRRSRNGTFVNDQRLAFGQRRMLLDEDRIRICDIKLTFRLDPDSTFAAEVSVSQADRSSYLDAQPADKLRVLLDVSTALRGTLDTDTILDRTLEHLFRLFPRAERGLVVFRESPTSPLGVRTLRTPSGSAPDPRFSTTVVYRCLEGVEAVLGNDLPTQFPESHSLSGLMVRSLMCAPLWTPDGKALGAIQLDTQADDRKFTPDDLQLLLGVVSQASSALSNARLHRESLASLRRKRDLEVAQLVQRALLPGALPKVPGYAFHAHYAAADQVGGDSYDFVPLSGGRLAVLLGDVSGHGVAAALVMARFGAEARACLESEPDPGTAIARLNALVLRAAVPDSFITLAAVILDPAAHTATVVNAGHPSPLLRRADGTVEEMAPYDSAGLMLGVAEGQTYGCREVPLGPGDAVLLFSDGLTEAMDGADRQFGPEGVTAVLVAHGPAPRATGEALAAAVKRHTGGSEQTDDITLVCFARAAE